MKKFFSSLWYLATLRWGKVGKNSSQIAIKDLSNTKVSRLWVGVPAYCGDEKYVAKALKKALGKKGKLMVNNLCGIEISGMTFERLMEVVNTRQSSGFSFYVQTKPAEKIVDSLIKLGLRADIESGKPAIEVLDEHMRYPWTKVVIALGEAPPECDNCGTGCSIIDSDGYCEVCGHEYFPPYNTADALEKCLVVSKELGLTLEELTNKSVKEIRSLYREIDEDVPPILVKKKKAMHQL